MTRPSYSSKTTTPQPSPAAPMTAAERIAHRERLRAPWHLLVHCVNANDLGKLIEAPEEAPAAPAAEPQA